jgi:putative phosphoesterase
VQTIKLGILSDTHIPHRLAALPPTIPEIFRATAVSLILHAGDVDEPGVLDTLSTVAPVIAVRGNIHLASRSRSSPHLPYAVHLDVMGQRVVLTHGHGRPHQWLWDKRRGFIREAPAAATRDAFNEELIARNHRRFPNADILIFGHSHRRLCRCVGRTLFLNPGAIAHARDESPSVAILTIRPEGANAEFIEISGQQAAGSGQ